MDSKTVLALNGSHSTFENKNGIDKKTNSIEESTTSKKLLPRAASAADLAASASKSKRRPARYLSQLKRENSIESLLSSLSRRGSMASVFSADGIEDASPRVLSPDVNPFGSSPRINGDWFGAFHGVEEDVAIVPDINQNVQLIGDPRRNADAESKFYRFPETGVAVFHRSKPDALNRIPECDTAPTREATEVLENGPESESRFSRRLAAAMNSAKGFEFSNQRQSRDDEDDDMTSVSDTCGSVSFQVGNGKRASSSGSSSFSDLTPIGTPTIEKTPVKKGINGKAGKLVHDPVTTTLGGFSRVTNFLREQMGPPKGSRSYRNELPDPFSDLPNLMFTSPQDDPDFEIITRIDRNSPNDPTDPSSGRGSASSGADNATPTVDGQNSPWTSRRHSPKVLEELPPRPEVVRGLPITSAEWSKNMNSEGRVQNVESLKQQIFRGGVDPPLRIEVWKFLLGYYDYKSTYKERQEQRKTRVDDYFRMKLQWKSLSSDQESRFSALKDRKALIEKDVNRTDRTHRFFQGEKNPNLDVLSDILMTYVMYNFDLGYVQGMSDLLAPVLVVMENEVDAFWCFAGFMEIIGKNFEMDQSTMKLQMTQLHAIIEFVDPQLMQYLENHESGNLYFCFRWLLIHFKREFSFPDVMRLWETLWTGHPCRNFHLLVCVALLDNEKSVLVENEFGFTEILKHINDLSGTIDIESLLKKAEGIFLQIAGCRSPPRMVAEILGLEAMLCPSLPSQSAISPKIKARGSNAFSTPSPQPSLSRTKSPSPTGSSTPHSSIEVLGTQSDDDDDVMV